jgi:DNA polymerase III subunit chi
VTEVLFYHLDRLPLERVLPGLLEKCLERQWHAVVQVGSEERCEALDAHLWTYRDDAFLPHGSAKDGAGASRAGAAEVQPVWLTTADDNPNGARVRFLADGVEVGNLEGYQRVVVLFDGNDREAVERARTSWTSVKAAGHDATYWQQDEHGRWAKKS